MNEPTHVVFDANLWLNIALVTHPYHASARHLLEDCLASNVEILAPALWEPEADSALRLLQKHKMITRRAEAAAQKVLNAAPVRVAYELHLRREAQRFADLLKHPRTYDATYVALAHAKNCELWTADLRLFNASQNIKTPLSFVRFVAQYAGEYVSGNV